MQWLNEARKTIGALVIGVLGWATGVVESGSDSITATEWIALGTVVAVALGVYAIPNQPPAPKAVPEPEDHPDI